MMAIKIAQYTLTTALGAGKAAHINPLTAGISALTPIKIGADAKSFAGRVEGLDVVTIPTHLHHYDCRNNRLAYSALVQDNFLQSVINMRDQLGSARGGIFVGTSTSGILSTEQAYRQSENFQRLPSWYHYPFTQNPSSLANFVAALTGISGPAYTVSTACSSSAKVFASALRALNAGVIDYALVGGVDSLCDTTLQGFNSLQLVDSQRCKPFDRNRSGINLGEAGGFALLVRGAASGDLTVLGVGESSDAYHMSSPHPEGVGAYVAMQQALASAGINCADINYINLHGTATPANDLAEGKAVTRLFATTPLCSSTKGFTGHTLGAAGIVEINLCLLAIEYQKAWGNTQLADYDAATGLKPLLNTQNSPINLALSNSFGFGGSNCSVVVGQ
ncbi:MAG TPA: beta-ketoacyl-ACP synthase [Cellvibrionaceae bacterium]